MDLTPRFSANFNRALGKRLKEARGRNLSALNLSAIAGVKHELYLSIEAGTASAPAHIIPRLAAALCVTTDHLMCLSSDGDGANETVRDWLLNAAALQAANRAQLAKRIANAEHESEATKAAMCELVGCTTDLLAALDEVIARNGNAFEFLLKGAALVSAAEEARTANAIAIYNL